MARYELSNRVSPSPLRSRDRVLFGTRAAYAAFGGATGSALARDARRRTAGLLDHAADDIDAHGQDGDVEYKRKHAVYQGQAAHVAGDDGDVRNLRSHPHHERVIGEIEVIGLLFARKPQTANMVLRRILTPVVTAGIVKREQRLDQQPR